MKSFHTLAILIAITLVLPASQAEDFAAKGCEEYTGYWLCPKTADVTGCDDLGEFWSCPKQTTVEDIGCEKQGNAVLCPGVIPMMNGFMELTSDVLCYWIDDELMACGANGTLLSPYSFEECWLYYELKDGEVDPYSVDYSHGCKEKTWPKDTELEIDFASGLFNQCTVVEETDYDRLESCGGKGLRMNANGTIDTVEGAQVFIIDFEEHTGFYMPLEWLVIGLVVLAVIAWFARKKLKK